MARTAHVAILAVSLLSAAAWAQDVPLRPFAYHEGFEGDAPQVTLWATNGEQTVNFLGPTDEVAFEGNRSLKLDVTLDSGSYHYWGVSVRVPAMGRVKLSARVLVAEGNTAGVGFGTNMQYPPTRHSGCGSVERYDRPTDGWQLVEVDLVERGREGAASVMAGHAPTVYGDEVGAWLDRWAVFVYGGQGRRAVVYLDDVRIEGEVPAWEDFQAATQQRWATNQERFGTRVAGWRERLEQSRGALAAIEAPPDDMAEAVRAVQESAARAEGLIDDIAGRGYGSRADVDGIEEALFTAQHGPETIAAITEGIAAGHPYLIYAPPAITNARITDLTFPIPARVATEVEVSGCRGEYEAATVAVYALEDIGDLLLEASSLFGPGGEIPGDAVDIYVVKSWYQAGRGIGDLRNKTYVPELLLKDDRLVRVDTEAQENYLRHTAQDGTETYLHCSGPTSEHLEGVRPIDADELLPVDVPARTLKQFWLRVHIPTDIAAGVYEGTLAFRSGETSRALPLRLTVHPVDLYPSRLIYSIYYRARLSPDGQPTITSERKSEEQYRAEMADLQAHGVLYPTNYQGWDEELLRRVLDIRLDLEMPTEHFFNLGRQTGSPTGEGQLQGLRDDVRKWIELCREYGYEDVYFYGIDEARGERLAAQQAAWRAVQEAGGKSFVACYKGTFEAMGDLLNCAVLAGRPDPEEAEKWHGVGSLAFTYAYPQVGNEEPETYRRNFGLVLWKAGFDGAMNYAYQHGFNHVWNDFDHSVYRDHNFTYPTVNGIVGTVQWEGFREAVDDVRYVTTLEAAIAEAPAQRADLAAEARRWLDELDPDTADLYETRRMMVDWIARLR